MKAILFARVSTQEQMKEGYSISAQMEQMRRYSAVKDFKNVEEFEIDESSTKDNRAKFDKVISIIEKQQAPIALVVETIDRLLRRFKDLPKLEQLIEQNKLELHCLRETLMYQSNFNQRHQNAPPHGRDDGK
jgi:site-specific DNA recombinase